MPFKFPKEVTTHLFKYVRRVDISYNPVDARSTSVREVWRQVMADRYKNANPKLEIEVKTHMTPTSPKAHFTFHDDSEEVYEGEDYNAQEILYSVNLKIMQMNTTYELDGKNIDDLM